MQRSNSVPTTVFHRFRQRLGILALCVLTCALLNLPAAAQVTTADIVGSVTDVSGAALIKARISVTNKATLEQRVAQTNTEGAYTFTLLPPGHYSIRVEAQGFKVFTVNDLMITAGDRARTDARMEVGAVSETIEVQASTPLLQTENSTVTSTITDQAVQDLPLNGRNFIQLVQLTPGANEGPGNGLTSGGRPDDRRTTNGISVNGQDDILNNQLIDGVDNNERIIGTIGVKPSVDAIQEVSVQTNEYTAEIGRTAGGVINVITKSGTNKFHGTLYEFLRNDIFDARNPFTPAANAKPELRQNQFGGSIGGPIVRNKTFFFADYEALRLVSGVNTNTFTGLPTAAQLANPQAIVAADPQTAALPIDPIALNYFKLLPTPNSGPTTFVSNPNKTQFSHTVDARIDHHFDDRNLFYGRYTYNNVSTLTPPPLPTAANGIDPGGARFNFSGPAKDTANGIHLNFTHIFTPSLLLELKAAYTRINVDSNPLNFGTNADSKVGFGPNMNFNQESSGLTPVLVPGLPDLGDGVFVPLNDIDNTFQYGGAVTYNWQNHTFKSGATLIRRQARNVQSNFPLGTYNFGLAAPGFAQSPDQNLATFLVGAFVSDQRANELAPPDYRTWEPSFYVQDNWKIRRWLTLNLGIRYDLYTPFTEAHNRLSNFDPTTATLLVAGQNGVSDTANVKTDYTNWAPRVGFAASIGHGMVVRGGFGLSYFPGNYTSNASLKNAPFVSVYNPNCESLLAFQIRTANGVSATAITPVCPAGQNTFDAGLPIPTSQTINSPALSFVSVDRNFRNSMVEQFNLLVEKQFGANVLTVGYVGDLGRHLPETINDINVPPPNNIGLPRPLAAVLPNLGAVNDYVSEGSSSYHGLQTSFQRRYSRGLTLGANYTWSHAIDDVSSLSEEGQQGWSDGDPFHIRQIETGNSGQDIRHRFVVTGNYELPFGKGFTGLSKILLAGWQTNAILAWQTGKPFSITNGNGGPGPSNLANPLFNNGPDRPNLVGNPSVPDPNVSMWFNPAAFQPQTPGTVGTVGRNSLYGPHFRHIDFSLSKNFQLAEQFKLQFRTEFFNLTNTPNFFINNNVNGNPNVVVGTSAFGKITQTDPNYTPREVQFALKLLF